MQGNADARAHLDADRALFEAVSRGGDPGWRLYVTGPAVVVGRHQRIEREVNLETCARRRTPVLRRFTGGGAVFLDGGCLNFAVAEPRRAATLDYGRYTAWLRDLASSFGVEAVLAGNRVEAGGRKISGLAARVSPRAIFVHGTFLVSTDLRVLRGHLAVPRDRLEALRPPEGPHVKSVPRPETTLSREAGKAVSMDEVRARASRLLEKAFGAPPFCHKRVLLHVCCAPCATVAQRRLRDEGWEPVLFFENSNLHPREEFELRLAETKRYARETGLSLVVPEPDFEDWERAVRGLEDEPEGGARCDVCFAYRLRRTARAAAEGGFDAFASTLSLSPHKKSARIDRAGEACAARHGTTYLPTDFKKRNGFAQSAKISKDLGLYRQDYCGCRFSLREKRRRDSQQRVDQPVSDRGDRREDSRESYPCEPRR